jgi:hypothetical protein
LLHRRCLTLLFNMNLTFDKRLVKLALAYPQLTHFDTASLRDVICVNQALTQERISADAAGYLCPSPLPILLPQRRQFQPSIEVFPTLS